MKLRSGYKQTDIGVLPKDWSISRVGDEALKVGSGITPTGGESVYQREGRPFVRSQNVGWGELLLNDVAYISNELHESFASTEIKVDDVFLNITGASIGRSAVADARVANGNVNQHVCIVRPKKKSLNARFLNYILLSGLGQRQIDSFQAGGNRQGLNFEQIRSLELPVPQLDEQRAIAAALSDTDAFINSLDRLLAKKRDIKQAVMQQLLTGKQRLPGFSGVWDVKRLSELGYTFGGLTGKTKTDFGEGVAKYIPFLNIIKNVVVDPLSLERVIVAPAEVQNLVAKGDLFFNGSSETPEEVGMCSVLLERMHNTYLNSFCFGYRLKEGAKASGIYLAYYFRSNEGRKLVFSLAQGATRYNLSKTNFLKLAIPFPELSEQTAIAAVLSDMDAEIDALIQRRDKTRAIKQGMMQELLTGRTRLI